MAEPEKDLEKSMPLSRGCSEGEKKSKVRGPTSFLAWLEEYFHGLFKSKLDRLADHSAKLSREELWELYDSPEFADLSGFERLQKVHKIAPTPLVYDSTRHLETFLRFSGTGLEAALKRLDLWALLIFHITVSVVYYAPHRNAVQGTPASGWPNVKNSMVAIPGALIAFVMAFYLNQTFTRYLTQYGCAITINGTLEEVVLLLRVHLGDHLGPEARRMRHKLCKIAIAMKFVAYGSLPWNRKAKIHEWVWWHLQRNKILTPAQVNALRSIQEMGTGNMAHKELLTWLERGVWAGHDKKYYVPHVATNCTSRIIALRNALDGLYTFMSGTVPFAYFTLLNTVTLLYLFILGYTFIFEARLWSILGYFLVLLCFMGVMEIGNKMSNPLGNDKIDIPVFQMANRFLHSSIKIINTPVEYPDEDKTLKPPPFHRTETDFEEDESELLRFAF